VIDSRPSVFASPFGPFQPPDALCWTDVDSLDVVPSLL
jgi:hypothetical protein